MAISIKYSNNYNVDNNNIIIFVSSLSQLKSIDFPINFDVYLKNKFFKEEIENNNYVILSNVISKNQLIPRLSIYLINKNQDHMDIGSSIFEMNSKNALKKTSTFIFSSYMKLKSKNIIVKIIFAYLIRSYKFDKYKRINSTGVNDLILCLHKINPFSELTYKLNLLKAINFTKDLVSEPANILNPVSYAEMCKNIKIPGLKVKILNQEVLMKIGMGSLLAVAQGSFNEPRVVIFEWNLKEKNKPTILVGKGVTFDSGGISLKPSSGMEEMITDMGGSAVVVGSMMNAALNKLNQSIVGIIGLVENMPDAKAQRPGDIITSLSGQTIEVLNTDAEGRMVLADIITYVQSKYNPKQIIDFATLTGAIMIALGTHKAGLFSNNDKLAKKIEDSGFIAGEKVWRLPMGIEYDKEIDSTRADMKNIGSTRYGGSIQAAQFIKRFVKANIPWAHLDLAGVSWSMKGGQNSTTTLHSPGATAFGVRLIDKFLKGK